MESNLVALFSKAEAFISGFEYDDSQQGVTKLLSELRTALESLKPAGPPVLLSTQSMSCAPKNQVILTDEGLVRYVDPKDWGSPVTRGWYNCNLDGDIASCADDGMAISHAAPRFWTAVPLLATPEASAALVDLEQESAS